MSEMKADMGGGAIVSASLYDIAKLGLPINVVATIPFVKICFQAMRSNLVML